MLLIRVSMRPIFHRHYRPLNPFKSPFAFLKPNQTKPNPTSPFSLLSTSQRELSFLSLQSPSSSLQARSLAQRYDMAQRTEKEETEFKVPETLTLCVNNCGVTANPATNNMCQNCFNATTPPSSSASSSAATAQIPALLKFSSGEKTPRSATSSRSPRRSDATAGSRNLRPQQDRTAASESESTLAMSRREVKRCSGCRRKVGLTGFRCRCGDLFCAEHRYSDRHVCSYDYKAAGREAIARENPVVKAAKIVKV